MGYGWLGADFPILPPGAESTRRWSDLCVLTCGFAGSESSVGRLARDGARPEAWGFMTQGGGPGREGRPWLVVYLAPTWAPLDNQPRLRGAPRICTFTRSSLLGFPSVTFPIGSLRSISEVAKGIHAGSARAGPESVPCLSAAPEQRSSHPGGHPRGKEPEENPSSLETVLLEGFGVTLFRVCAGDKSVCGGDPRVFVKFFVHESVSLHMFV